MTVLYHMLGVQAAFWAVYFVTIGRDPLLRWVIRRLATVQQACYWAIKVPTWRSADGRVLRADEFSDSHLLNTLRLIQREGQTHPITHHLRAEASRRRLSLKRTWR